MASPDADHPGDTFGPVEDSRQFALFNPAIDYTPTGRGKNGPQERGLSAVWTEAWKAADAYRVDPARQRAHAIFWAQVKEACTNAQRNVATEPEKSTDAVFRPAHYARYQIEPVTFIQANKLPFAVGNVIKYVCRYDAKNGLEDLRKAARYLDIIIQEAEAAARGESIYPRACV